MQLFEYVVIYNPNEKEVKAGKEAEILIPIKHVLAESKEVAAMMATREIPAKYGKKLGQISVHVRPF